MKTPLELRWGTPQEQMLFSQKVKTALNHFNGIISFSFLDKRQLEDYARQGHLVNNVQTAYHKVIVTFYDTDTLADMTHTLKEAMDQCVIIRAELEHKANNPNYPKALEAMMAQWTIPMVEA